MGSFNAHIVPTSTGLAFGNVNQKWIAYLSNVFADNVQSNTSNPALTGFLRLANADVIAWRNAANSADVTLSKTSTASTTTPADTLVWGGAGIQGPLISHNLNPSATGELRLTSTDTISWRNNANTADLALISKNSADQLVLVNPLFSAANFLSLTTKSLSNVRFADQYTGGDVGAKINAASADLGSGHGEIWVTSAAGTAWLTSVSLPSNRTVRFFEGATYAGNGVTTFMIGAVGTSGTHVTNVHIIGSGTGSTYLTSPSTGTQIGAVAQFVYCDDCSIENLSMDGSSNTTTVLVDEMNSRFTARNLNIVGDAAYNVNRNYCIHVRGSQNGSYEDIYTTGGSQDGILIGVGPFGAATQSAQLNRFNNITAINSPANGIDLGGTASLIVQYNNFTNIVANGNGATGLSGGTDDRYGLNLNFASSNSFINVTTQTNSWSGIRLNSAANNSFMGVSSDFNGQAGAATGDAIRLENGTSGVPNSNNQFFGVAHSLGSNYAVGTAGTHTAANLYVLELGAATNNLAATGGTDFPITQGVNLLTAPSPSITQVDLTAQTAAITTATLYAVPATGAGEYRLSWNAKITTAAGTSSTLGALTIVYTDPDGVAVTITAPASIAAGTIATTSAANTTGTVLLGLPLLLNAKASTNITYAFAYASNAAAAMNFNLHLKLQFLI